MNKKPLQIHLDDDDELTRLISRLLDETVDDGELENLETLLSDSSEARRTYLAWTDQHCEIGISLPHVKAPGSLIPQYWPEWGTVAAAAAAVIILMFFLFDKAGDRNDPPLTKRPGIGEGPGSATPISRPDPSIPSEWVANFEQGLPRGWKAEFVTEGLPAGSRGAVRTFEEIKNGVVYQQIIPPMAWGVGHFVIHEDSHLHLKFKVEKSTWCDIFLLTHIPDREGGFYKMNEDALWAEEGEWMRASIPLASFDQKNPKLEKFIDGKGPGAGEVAWQIFFSAANSTFKMIIDEIRVDRNGPGRMVVEKL